MKFNTPISCLLAILHYQRDVHGRNAADIMLYPLLEMLNENASWPLAFCNVDTE